MKPQRLPPCPPGIILPFKNRSPLLVPEPEPEPKPSGLPRVCAASLAGKPVPPRKFIVEGLIPDRTTTMMSAKGGSGKSTVAGQLGVGVSTTGNWLGLPTERGPVVFLSAEDELDELHRRLAAIADAEGLNIAECRDLHFVPLAGQDAVLGAPDKKSGLIRETLIWRQLCDLVDEIQPKLVIIDTLADVFGGNEIVRAEARQFVGMLNGLAIENNLAVVLLAHPSLNGIANGTGSSGSTAWEASVRSRLYMDSIIVDGQETDTDLRVLKVVKANYSKRGTEIRLRWRDGIFVSETPAGGFDKFLASANADRVFLALLKTFNAQGRAVSPSPSNVYAPTLFASHPNSEGITKRVFTDAMNRLLAAEMIGVETSGTQSRRRQRLVISSPEASEPTSERDDL